MNLWKMIIFLDKLGHITNFRWFVQKQIWKYVVEKLRVIFARSGTIWRVIDFANNWVDPMIFTMQRRSGGTRFRTPLEHQIDSVHRSWLTGSGKTFWARMNTRNGEYFFQDVKYICLLTETNTRMSTQYCRWYSMYGIVELPKIRQDPKRWQTRFPWLFDRTFPN